MQGLKLKGALNLRYALILKHTTKCINTLHSQTLNDFTYDILFLNNYHSKQFFFYSFNIFLTIKNKSSPLKPVVFIASPLKLISRLIYFKQDLVVTPINKMFNFKFTLYPILF